MTNETRHIEAVIFDLDGLLIDSEPLQFRAWSEYVATLGHTLTPEVLSQMLGRRLIDSSRIVVDAFGLDMPAGQVAEERDRYFLAMVPGQIGPQPGAIDLVETLHRRQIPMALATSGHRRYVDMALESAAIPRLFTAEVTGDLVTHGKPHPETFLTAASLLGIEPARCLVLEDAPNGVRAAVAAGMQCIAIPGHGSSPADLAGADAILDSLAGVIGWLDQWVTSQG